MDLNASAKRVARQYVLKFAGGSDFEEWVSIPDANRAFQAAREDAGYDRGQGGYSGTIYEKDDFEVVSRTPLSKSQIRAMMGNGRYSYGRNDKWGPAFAAPYAKEKILGEKEYTVRVKAKDEQAARRAAKEIIAAKGRARKGTTVTVDLPWGSAKLVRPAGQPKVTVEKITEKAKMQVGNHEAKNLTEAKKLAAEILGDRRVGDSLWIRKVQTVGKVIKTEEAARLAVFEVTGTRKQVAVSNKVEGWVFWGIASS